MRKDPNARWIKLHTIAKYERYSAGSSDGIIAVVDGNEAGIAGFACDSYFDFEMGIELTEQPRPEQLFDIPEWVNPWDYVSRQDYVNHPKVKDFSPEISWLWEGTSAELFYAAQHKTDVMFPNRKICEEDVDFKQMSELYSVIRRHLLKKSKKSRKGKLNGGGFSEVFSDE